MNPFQIGDTVTLKDPSNAQESFRGDHAIKDIRFDEIRLGSTGWWHYSHFAMVKPGLLTRVGRVTGAIPESHPILDREFVRTASVKDMEDAGFTLERDPKGLEAGIPGAKNDLGKVEAGLLLDFGLALQEVARVCTFGARKYSRQGWLHVDDGPRRYRDAGVRHQLAGNLEDKDEESNLLHLSHQAWNVLAELELRLRACKNNK